MANDFPTAPTIGDTVAFNNILYSWDGTKWNGSQNANLDSRFVQVAGDTMTGDLVANTTGALTIPTGTEAQKPTAPLAGATRLNTTSGFTEVYTGATLGWRNLDYAGLAKFDWQSAAGDPTTTNPTTLRSDGTALAEGDQYWDTTSNQLYAYDLALTSWGLVGSSGGSIGVDAWGDFASDGSLSAGLNVASVTRVGVGVYDVVFNTPMPSSDYAVTLGGQGDSSADSQTANGFTIYTFSSFGTAFNAQQSFAVFATNATLPAPLTQNMLVMKAGDTMTGDLIPAATGQSGYISRTGTTLSPSNTGDSVDIGSGNITLAADGSITALADATINTLTVGLGGGSAATNTAVGNGALLNNTTGESNTALGINALRNNTTGFYNTAIGQGALYNATGEKNTALGFNALYDNTTGNHNTAVGHQALFSNTTGSGNVMIGGVRADGTYDPVFTTTTQNDRIVMGSTSVTNAYVKVAWTVTSDARDKTNFAPVPHGLDFVKQLQPTAYQFKAGNRNARNPETNELIPVTAADELPSGPVLYGFKAQDILALEGDNPIIIDNEDPDHLKYRGEALVPVLVNAIKEQQVLIDALTARLDAAGGL